MRSRDELESKMEKPKEKSRRALREQGFEESEVVFEEYFDMRYRGRDSALMIIKPDSDERKKARDWDFGTAFVQQHRYEFGFTLDDRDISVDDVRVQGIGKSYRHGGEDCRPLTSSWKSFGARTWIRAKRTTDRRSTSKRAFSIPPLTSLRT
ncbi:Uncharacterized protein CTA2_11789 [Colletotrichum tanaceti]|uniref:Uncharacterized protein n=1 Tax=Colletotrichum tanaceti TaxID=1306861 RepID=A0A4V6Y9H6_9PEZI|nr:Uncharacterized protein CTA2_11789 [Colletotrichum tanaceti]TKW55406.1 uncharacterized protein CTA1_2587 [Colletotrichum tanaceti]